MLVCFNNISKLTSTYFAGSSVKSTNINANERDVTIYTPKRSTGDAFVPSNEQLSVREKTEAAKSTRGKEDNYNKLHLAAKPLIKDAAAPMKYFEETLNDIFGKDIAKNDHILAIEVRLKTVQSLIDKMASRGFVYNKDTYARAKKEITDIIGARIILNKASKADGDKIIKKLINAVNHGKLNIFGIKNHYAEKTLAYAHDSTLKKLCDAANEAKAPSEPGVIFSYPSKNLPHPSGYTAIHIHVNLPNGYIGEIQIIGPDVASLKEIEDIYYKAQNNKQIHKGYDKFKDTISSLSPTQKKALQKYKVNAYIHERKKGLNGIESEDKNFLPLIDETLPPILDFNKVAAIKQDIEFVENAKKADKFKKAIEGLTPEMLLEAKFALMQEGFVPEGFSANDHPLTPGFDDAWMMAIIRKAIQMNKGARKDKTKREKSEAQKSELPHAIDASALPRYTDEKDMIGSFSFQERSKRR